MEELSSVQLMLKERENTVNYLTCLGQLTFCHLLFLIMFNEVHYFLDAIKLSLFFQREATETRRHFKSISTKKVQNWFKIFR